MCNTIKKLLTPLLLCISIIVHAQTDTLSVSLSQAMAYATEYGYQAINAQKDIEIAKKKVRETLAIGLPQVSASAGLIDNILIQEVVLDTLRFKMGTKYQGSLGGRVDQLLFDGSYLVGLKASKVYVALSENAKDKTDIEIKQAVAETYFLVLVAQQNILDFKTNYESNQNTLNQAQAYYENGFTDDIDLDQVKLMVSESKQLYLNAENQYTIAISVLKFAMGYPIEKPLKVTDNIEELLVTIPNEVDTKNDITSHIDYRILSTQIDIKNLDIQNQKALAIPKLYAFANYDKIWMGDDLSNMLNTKGAAIGVSLSIPIFSSGMRSAQLKQKKIQLDKLSVEQKMLSQNLKHNLLISKSNLENAKLQFENARVSKEIATRIYDNSLTKYKNGMMSSLDLSQNENKKVEAVISFHSACAYYFSMYLEYQKATSQL